MDIDLSTDLRALPPLVAPLLSGHSDIAIGSRLAHGSRVVRGAKREALSRGYNMLLHGVLGVSFSDAQCGFKAMTSRSARALLPLVKDNAWFFDTEFLVLAERAGLRIAEVPVDWMDDPVSSVNIGSTVRQDLRGVTRLSWNLARNRIPLSDVTEQLGRKPLVQGTSLPFQLVHFAIVGVASTIVFSLLYYLLQFVLTPQSANFIALAISAVFNTMVNRHVTFGVRDRSSAERHLLQGLLVFATTWLLTSGALALVHTSAGNVDPRRDLIVLTIANIFATVLRFVAFRFMFHPEPPHTTNRECRLTRLELLSA